MFDFLKKKISSWMSKGKDTKDKEEKKSGKIKKKENQKEKKTAEKKISKTQKVKKRSAKEQIFSDQGNESDIENDLKKLEDELGSDEKKEEKEEELEEDTNIKPAPQPESIKEEPVLIEDINIDKFKEKESTPSEGNFFTKIFKKITQEKLTQDDFNEIFNEFEITLLENNVALEAVDKIKYTLSKSLVGTQIKKSEAEQKILTSLKDSIVSVLAEPPNLLEQIKKHEGIFTIIFFGINGTGKTTSVAKLANILKKENIRCVLAAADTFRAASIEQLRTHADKLDIPVIYSKYGADPASVAFDAKKYAESHGIKVVLIDTAGRMYTKDNLLKEMEKMIRIAKPDLKIFVGESITGNDAIEQAKTFNDAIGIDGIILSKADVDEKAGTILSVSHVTGKPIYFLGTGQNYDDLQVFSKKTVLKNLGLE